MREQADYLFEPPLKDVGLRDWKAFDRAIAEGYAHAMRVIEKKGIPFGHFATEEALAAPQESLLRLPMDTENPAPVLRLSEA